MIPGLPYALAAMLAFGVGDLIYKRGASAGAPPHQLMMVNAWVFAPTVILYGLATGSLHINSGMAWGALVGVFMFVGFYNYAHSLRSGSVSINAPVFRLSFVITTVLAITFLHEAPTWPKFAGIALALAAVCLLLSGGAPPQAADKRAARSSLVRVLIATVAVGVGNTIYKLGLASGATPASLIAAQACVVVTLSTGFAFSLDRRIQPGRAALLHAPGSAVLLAIGFICMVESLAMGEASVMVPIAQMGLAVTAVLGFFLLGERFTPRKAAGLLAALGALGCFAFG